MNKKQSYQYYKIKLEDILISNILWHNADTFPVLSGEKVCAIVNLSQLESKSRERSDGSSH